MVLRRAVFVVILSMFVGGATDTTAQNKGPFNYGRRWSGWSPMDRSIYLEGFRDGQSHTYSVAISNGLPTARREPMRLETYTMFDTDVLAGVMTRIYADPANSYIQNEDMVYIARDKLSGKDVDASLREARAVGATPR